MSELSTGQKGAVAALAVLGLIVAVLVFGIVVAVWTAWWIVDPIAWVTGRVVPFWKLAAGILIVRVLIPRGQSNGETAAWWVSYVGMLLAPVVAYCVIRWMVGP